MTKINKKKIEEFIRVDHAGERGAIKIYEGQLLALNTFIKDDDLKIVTTYDKIKGARLWVNQSCYRGDELLVTAFSEAACISPEGKPKGHQVG